MKKTIILFTMVAVLCALLSSCTSPTEPTVRAYVVTDQGSIWVKSSTVIPKGQEFMLYNPDGTPYQPASPASPSKGTYIPDDIEVTDTTEGTQAVSFTHKDGIHYVLYFNEEKGT